MGGGGGEIQEKGIAPIPTCIPHILQGRMEEFGERGVQCEY